MGICKFKKNRRLLALPAAALSCASCALHDRTPPDEIVFALSSQPTNLDPRFATDSFSEKIDGLLFNGLMAQDSEGRLQPDLATRLEIPDPLTYHFTLRHDVRFHDGSPLTSEDVAYTFRSLLDPARQSIKRLSYEAVTRIDTPDAHTVTFHLSHPYAPFLGDLTLGIIPHTADLAGSPPSDHPIGTGPYRLESSARDQFLRLEANPLAYADKPLTPRLTFKIVPDSTVRALELLHGSVDMIQNDMPTFLISSLSERSGLQVLRRESSLVKYLGFNLEDPLLKDVRVRQAIAMAIDRHEIIRYRYRNYARAANSLLTPVSFAYAADIPGWPHNPQMAIRLLDSAGYFDPDGAGPRPRFSLVYRTSLDEVAIAVARVFQAQLLKVGIELKIRTSEWSTFFEDIKQGSFQLYSLTAVGVKDPDYYSYLCHSARVPPAGANRARYRSLRMDALLEQGRKALEEPIRRSIYREVQLLAFQDLPYLPLWSEENVAIMSPRISGYALTPNGDFSGLTGAVKRPETTPP